MCKYKKLIGYFLFEIFLLLIIRFLCLINTLAQSLPYAAKIYHMTHKATVHPVFNNISRKINDQLRDAKGSILVAVAWMGQSSLREILISKAKSGVPVYVIVSAHGFNEQDASGLADLAENGVHLYSWGESEDTNSRPLMHNKYCVVDNQTVITGSFNWTRKADINKENIAVIHGRNVASKYTNDFHELLQQSVNFTTGQIDPVTITLTADRQICGEGQDVTIEYLVTGADSLRIIGARQEEITEPGIILKKNLKNPVSIGIEATKDGIAYHRYISLQVVPKPKLKISADPEVVANGQTTVLRWEAENATGVVFLNENRQLGISGSLTLAPGNHKVYSFQAYNDYGSIEQSIRILVLPVPRISSIFTPLPYGLQIKMEIDMANQPVSVPIPLGRIQRARTMHLPVIKSLQSGSRALSGLYQKLSQELNQQKLQP